MVQITTSRVCPKCGILMERIPRKPWHRMLSIFIPVIHVICCHKKYLVFFKKKSGKAQGHSESDTFKQPDNVS